MGSAAPVGKICGVNNELPYNEYSQGVNKRFARRQDTGLEQEQAAGYWAMSSSAEEF